MMKRLLIGDSRENLLTTLETLLRHWGYRVLVSSRPQELTSLLRESPPDLLIFGKGLLCDGDAALRQAVRERVLSKECPLILFDVSEETTEIDLPHERLQVPLDIFALFALVQKHLEKYPRKNLRLPIQLPGLLCRGETSQLSEILSLSTHGVFVKTGSRLERGDRLHVLIPLLGMRKELEIEGRVLYRVHPDPDNGYLQGVGIEFVDIGEETLLALETFLENSFLKEVAAKRRRLGPVAQDQLQSRLNTLP